ncbi:MAG: glycosyltransferase family 1 protein [Planctomycetota bacterium]|nr:MAG: glycosyltransferase family 1 protein [Planctomycetota bacterium]REJ95427.1 MAG: glycosyltransferase family 1 protein [Planctomycetota bacterium]REK17603.1 MAG: glycosyltransferase family 1 protein [Planctomycetota bacterium]REK39845.1 MAG: glycosyltransferase family 1 protein [Planctomycetota bacterium]
MMISTHGYVSANPEFGKPDTGGQVVYILELAKCLGRLGFDVDIYTRQFEDQPQREVVEDRVQVVRIPCGGRDFIPKETLCDHIPQWVENAHEYIKKNEFEYAFINSHYWDAGLAGQSLSNILGIAHMHTPHSIGAWKRDNMDGDPQDLEGKYNFARRIREEKVIYDECDVLIATTPQQRDILKNGDYDVPSDKIRVIPPGYDDTRFFPVSTASRQTLKQQLDAEGPIVLALGRMAHNKGYDLLIRSMPYVLQRVPEARLILAVGSTEPSARETEQIDELRELTRELEIGESVLFRDYIPDDLLPDYYRVADVFALSSRYEPFGMTGVEAMACGTPTVITTEGGLWEQVMWGMEAIYANPFDPNAFGDAIATVLQYPQIAAQLAKYGTQKARARFTWTGIAQQLLRVLESVEPRVRLEQSEEPQVGPRAAWAVDPAEEELWKTAIS